MRELLTTMQWSENLPAEFRSQAAHILRHYPDLWIIESLARQSAIGGAQSPLGPLLDCEPFR